jgi:hypothetical protein
MIAFDAPVGRFNRILNKNRHLSFSLRIWEHSYSSSGFFRQPVSYTVCVTSISGEENSVPECCTLRRWRRSAGLICNNITYLYIASRNYHLGCSGFTSFWGANLFGRLFTDSCWLTAINKLFLNAITVSWCIVKICARMLFFFSCVFQFYEGEFQCFVFDSVKPASLFFAGATYVAWGRSFSIHVNRCAVAACCKWWPLEVGLRFRFEQYLKLNCVCGWSKGIPAGAECTLQMIRCWTRFSAVFASSRSFDSGVQIQFDKGFHCTALDCIRLRYPDL